MADSERQQEANEFAREADVCIDRQTDGKMLPLRFD